MRKRTRGRELALQLLYQVDVRGEDLLDDLDDLLLDTGKEEEVRAFAKELVLGTVEHREECDRYIKDVAEHWDIRRMATVDRNILRLAVYEMTSRDDIPEKVSINEAIELGKKYSTGNSGAFVNVILDKIRRMLSE